MIDLYYQGGPLFMGILTLIGLVIFVLSVVNARSVFTHHTDDKSAQKLILIKDAGLLALVVGVLATSIGLFEGFSAIEEAGDVSFGMMVGGLKVAIITSIYGFIIYALSLLIWLLLSWKLGQEV